MKTKENQNQNKRVRVKGQQHGTGCASLELRATPGCRERLEGGLAKGPSQELRREQMPVLTVTNPHGSIMIGHGNEVIHIRPC